MGLFGKKSEKPQSTAKGSPPDTQEPAKDPQIQKALDSFDVAEKTEHLFADIYRLLAKQFADNDHLGTTFTKLQQEELQHATRVNMLRRQYLDNAFQAKDVTLDTTALTRAAMEGATFREKLRSGDTVSAQEAIALMRRLEGEFALIHGQMIAKEANPHLHEFFATLASQDSTHATFLGTLIEEIESAH